MALDDVGANPSRIAAAIHKQLGEGSDAVPVFEIAKALDIIEIRHAPLTNFEGALITPPERGYGTIGPKHVGGTHCIRRGNGAGWN
jgi:hypothetical protein